VEHLPLRTRRLFEKVCSRGYHTLSV
jgi:hypothetical protein